MSGSGQPIMRIVVPPRVTVAGLPEDPGLVDSPRLGHCVVEGAAYYLRTFSDHSYTYTVTRACSQAID